METGVKFFGIDEEPTLVADLEAGEGERRLANLTTDTLESMHTISGSSDRAAKPHPSDSKLKLPLKPLVAVAGMTLLVLTYHLYLTRNQSQAASAGAGADTRITASASVPAPPSQTQPPRAAFDLETKAMILACTKGVRALSGARDPKSFMNLREYLEKAVSAPGHAPMETRLTARRLRLIDQNGRRMRLHVLPKNDAGEGFEIKLFGFNEDNLPVRMALTDELKSSNIFESIDRIKARGQVDLDEISETMIWDSKTSASVLRQNSKIVSLQLNFPNGELNCRSTEGEADSVSCICL